MSSFLKFGECVSGSMSKELVDCSRSYLKVKRRRMLQFDSHSMDPSLCCNETPSAFLRSDVSLRTTYFFGVVLVCSINVSVFPIFNVAYIFGRSTPEDRY